MLCRRAFLFTAGVLVSPELGEPAREVHAILPATRWETELLIVRGAGDGPTVLVMGGVHGDEPAGALAAESIARWPVERGVLLAIPRANMPALAVRRRLTPGSRHADLARSFPRDRDDACAGELASALWELVERVRPSWLLDLHEGFAVHRRHGGSLGSTVLHGPDAGDEHPAARMIAAVNATVGDPRDHFDLVRGFIPGSLPYAAHRLLGTRCLVQETTRTGRSLAMRVRQHQVMTARFLQDVGVASVDVGLEAR